MWQHRELEQAVDPVALVLFRVEILHLSAQCESLVEAVFSVGDVYVGVYHATLALDDSLVIVLVHVHEVEEEGA